MQKTWWIPITALAFLLWSLPACGSDVPDPTDDRVLLASGFLDSHPDLRYRLLGLEEYGKQNYTEAFHLFRRAAYYADKPSQAIVGEMFWAGVGTERDRALAFVWMSLAAERGYLSFRGKRDAYWAALDEAERKAALSASGAFNEEYADKVAEKRLASALRRGRAQMTGSRVGSQANAVQIVIPGHGSIDGSKFYDPRFWDPEKYRDWHDDYWMELRFGRVNLGDVEQVDNGPASAPGSAGTQPSPPED